MANVSITHHQEQFIQKKVKSGRYLSASEVVREALRLLEEREEARGQRIEALKRELEGAIAQVERGETVEAAVVFSDLRNELAQQEEQHPRR